MRKIFLDFFKLLNVLKCQQYFLIFQKNNFQFKFQPPNSKLTDPALLTPVLRFRPLNLIIRVAAKSKNKRLNHKHDLHESFGLVFG